jgi:hypothetical protein
VAGEVAREFTDALVEDLGLLLAQEQASGRWPLLEALLDHRSGDGPDPERSAAARILEQCASWGLDLSEGAATLLGAAGRDPSPEVFSTWVASRGRRSFQSIAEETGLSHQWVGRIVRRGGPKVRRALVGAPAPWPWVVSTLRARLGPITTEGDLADALGRLGVDPASTEAALGGWLAGPYEDVPGHPGWLAIEATLLPAKTGRCLSADGGVRRLVDVEAEMADLAELGHVAGDRLEAWLRECGAVVIHDLVVSTAGPLTGVVERVLDAHGTARSPEEIAAEMTAGGRAVTAADLAPTLRSQRFKTNPTGRVRLAAWGIEKPNEKTKTPSAKPKQASRRTIPGSANVTGAHPVPAQKQAGDDRLWLWVRVDADVLHGSEAPVPAALAEGLGLDHLARRTFSSRWGPITLTYEGPQPMRGSVRAVAMAAGAGAGDTLLLGFSAAGHVEVEVRSGSARIAEAGESDDPTIHLSEHLTEQTR